MHRQLLMAAALLAAFSEARAQDPFGPRPGVTITPFEFGTAASYGTHSAGRSRYPGPYVYPDAELAAQLIEVIGTGLADLVGERLVESERFRVYERRQLEAVQREQELDRGDDDSIARARYLITGSISLLGNTTRTSPGSWREPPLERWGWDGGCPRSSRTPAARRCVLPCVWSTPTREKS